MHIVAKKNAAYYLSFPMVDSTTPAQYATSASVTDTAYYKDGAGAWTSLAITDTATEIGGTGVYEIDLTASEMNHDKVLIKFTASGAADTGFMFDLRTKLTDDLNDITAANVVDEWETQSQADPTGFHVNVLEIGGTAQTANDNGADINAILLDTDELQTDDIPTLIAALPTAAENADAVWDEVQSGHVGVGTFGEMATETADILADTNELQTDNVPGLIAALNDPTAADIADAVWDEAQSGHVGVGTFGEIATETAAIQAKTDNLPADPADDSDIDAQLATIAGYLDTEIAAIKTVTDALPDAGALTTITSNIALILADTGTDGVVISSTTANAIADAILNRDFSSVSDTNARTALNALRFLRNKWSIAATTLTVTKEDDSTSAWTATVSTDAAANPVTGNDPA